MPEAMHYISLFSGIEAASAAWSQLGWEPIAFSEIEPFCCDLLDKRFPSVPNLGDVSTIEWSKYEGAADVIIGGSPCQAYSIAGKREGMLDDRGLLMLEYVRAVREVKPRWVVWENVPGVLSQDGGRAFAALLEELEECGYSLAWRVLDAQYWGVAQRRRRVFLVGHPIAGCAAAVLFEPESLCRSNQASREKREELAATSGSGAKKRCWGILGNVCDRRSTQNGSGVSAEIAPTLNTVDRHVVAGCLKQWDVQSMRVYGQDGSAPTVNAQDSDGGKNSAAHPPTIAFSAGQSDKAGSCGAQEEVAPTLRSSASGTNQVPTIAFNHSALGTRGFAESKEDLPITANGYAVRRLTPMECERLQGFQDGWTEIYDNTPDTPRYKAIGNSMAVPVIKWIGEQIAMVEDVM